MLFIVIVVKNYDFLLHRLYGSVMPVLMATALKVNILVIFQSSHYWNHEPKYVIN